jgi:hypothetical protein
MMRSRIAGIVATVLWLATCSGDPAQNPAWTLAGHPGLLYWVKFYYERNALEENGRCTAPLLEGVSRAEVLSEDQDQLVVALVYRYRDALRDEPRAPSGRLPFFRECTGVASRTFTIATGGDHPTVISMNGSQKRRQGTRPRVGVEPSAQSRPRRPRVCAAVIRLPPPASLRGAGGARPIPETPARGRSGR